jgi:signal transduction histidine kinase
MSAERTTAFPRAAGDNGHVAQSSRRLMPAGRAARLAARVRSAARRPLLSGISYVGDLALAAAVTIAAVVTAVMGFLYVPQAPRTIVLPGLTYTIGPPQSPHLLAVPSWALAGVVATTAPLAFRRTYPTGAFVVVLVAFIATRSYSTAITVAAVIFAAYCAVVYSEYRRTTLLALLAGGIILTVAYPESTAQVAARYIPLLVLLPTVAVGNMMRMWRERAGESAERLRLAQAGHEAEKRRAVTLERARIASELHDVVTHNVSVMVVQAGAARRVLEGTPGEAVLAGEAQLAREALLAVEASGRSAMTDLQHLLGLLAPVDEPTAASTGPGELRPQPGVDQVPALIDRVRAAGLDAGLSVTGTRRPLPAGLDLAAYRVVQEALTNVLKHAGPARTTVHVEYRPRELQIKVFDDGRPTDSGVAYRQPPGPGGRGLIGLRERIAIYRGELDAGPRPGGGWQVSAKIPLEPVAGGLDEARAGYQARSS